VFEPFLANVEVGSSRGEPAVTEQPLQRQRVDASFQQMSGEAVAKMPSSAFSPKCRVPGNAEPEERTDLIRR